MLSRYAVRSTRCLRGGVIVFGMLVLWGAFASAQPVPTPASPPRPNGGWGAAWSPQGDRLAFLASDDGLPAEAWVSDPHGQGPRRITHGGADDLAWSADGRTLRFISTRRGRAERWQVDLASGQESPQPAVAGLPADALPVPSPDGTHIAYTHADQHVRDLYVVTGSAQPERATLGFMVGAVAWSPKGDRIAFDGLNELSKGLPQVWLYDLPTKKLAHIGSAGSFGPVWSAKGDLLAYTIMVPGKGNRIAIAVPDELAKVRPKSKHARADKSPAAPIDAREGEMVKGLLYQGDGLAWSPNTDLLAVVTRADKGQQLWLVKANGRAAAKLAKPGLKFRFPVWSPDGKRLALEAVRTGASAFSEVWVTDARGRQWRNLTPSRPSYWALSPAAGNRLYFLGNTAGTVAAWSLAAAGPAPLPNTNGAVAVAAAPAGDRVLVLKAQEVALLSAGGSVLSTLPLSGAMEARWSPQGDRVAVGLTGAMGEGTIELLSVSAEGKLAEGASTPGADPAWRPDGAALACVRGKELWQVDAEGKNASTLATVPVAEGEEALAMSPAWDGTGQRLVFGVTRAAPAGWSHELWLATPGTPQPFKLYTEEAATEYAFSPARWSALPAWTPEGRILFAADREGAPQVWSLLPDGSDLRPITTAETVWPALGPEALYFIRLGADTPLWKAAADGSQPAPLAWHQ